MQTDEIRVVQFPHPGTEHRPDNDGNKEWNELPHPHARKFLQQRGRYVNSIESKPATADLHFWGEWEPQSKLVRAIEGSAPNHPRNVVRPFLRPRRDVERLHTTDPFVFGDTFYYSHCKMIGKMTRLARGSVILFGSRIDGGFVLDTVFVVDEWMECTLDNFQSLPVPSIYQTATLEPLYSNRDGCKPCLPGLRLYCGAMRSRPFEGMFSFFPCLPANRSNGFARPTVRKRPYINPNNARALKITECGIEQARSLWQAIANQVLNTRVDGERLRLGVFAELPEQVK